MLGGMPSKPQVLVVGSSNTDLVVYCDRLPHPGETVLGGEFRTFGGGKGANQAVAAARAGGEVSFLGAHGADAYGQTAKERLQKEGINVEQFVCVANVPSGVALILVDGRTRENLIAVAKSANEAVDSAMISAARKAFLSADVVVSQLEIRDGAVEAVARLCHELARPFILNPAPSRPLPRAIYESLTVVVVNEHEAHDLSGESDFPGAIRWFLAQGCKNVVVTEGAQGVTYSSGGDPRHIDAPKVEPVDTTGAGDCFVGWLAVGLGEGLMLDEAVQRATIAASLAVTRSGAQDGMPYRHEVLEGETAKRRNGDGATA